jgi:hypothetical protein
MSQEYEFTSFLNAFTSIMSTTQNMEIDGDVVNHTDVADSLQALAQKHKMTVVPVSWEDCTRGWDSNGKLSCYGNNISDVRILDKTKRSIYTLRSENWNERLAVVSASDVAVVVGNDASTSEKNLKSVTLKTYLKSAGIYGSYVGLPRDTNLLNPEKDDKISVRFQTVFLPTTDEKHDGKNAPEFTSSVYSYSTTDKNDPQNLLLYCTSQGTSLHQDAPGQEKLFLHMTNPDDTVSTYWLKAVTSDYKVGAAQKETEASAKLAAEQNQAVAQHIGLSHMGTRFNVVMLVQIPLKKVEETRGGYSYSGGYGSSFGYGVDFGSFGSFGSNEGFDGISAQPCAYKSMKFGSSSIGESLQTSSGNIGIGSMAGSRGVYLSKGRSPPRAGTASAARVSLGTMEEKKWSGLSSKNFKRNPDQHITVTVTMYYTVKGGVPSEADVEAAISDLEKCYSQCGMVARLDQLEPVGITSSKKNPIPNVITFGTPLLDQQTFPVDN